ncbi:hypothetical protein P4C99_17765 [Pontiellaceae bacterium B1224]|nr:hypothetical protein [Pontiellaceae bacterium B1224]
MKIAETLIIVFFATLPYVRGEVEFDVPDEIWKSLYFKPINELTVAAELAPLQEKTIEGQDGELRIWKGFGLSHLKGLIIEKRKNGFLVTYLRQSYNTSRKTFDVSQSLIEPKIPPKMIWEWLESEGLFHMPDDSKLESDGIGVVDGVSYVFEYRNYSVYRTFKYGNPGLHLQDEAKQIYRMMMVLEKEFGIDFYQSTGALPEYVSDGQVVLVNKGDVVGAYQLFGQEMSSPGNPHGSALLKWAYCSTNSGVLNLNNCKQGDIKISNSEKIEFGPFSSIRWSIRSEGKGRVYYPDPDGTLKGDPGREFVAITDEYSMDGINWSDSKWKYKATHVELPKLPWE